MAESASVPPEDRPAQKPRVKAPVPFKGPLPTPPDEEKPPLHRRAWFLILVAAAILAASPIVFTGWNLLRPDSAPSPRFTTGKALNSPVVEGSLAAFASAHAKLLAEHPEYDADIAAGAAYDETRTPAYLAAADRLAPDALPTLLRAGVPTLRIDALAKLDDLERAHLAALRAEPLSDESAARLRSVYIRRLDIARALLASATSPESFDTAIDYTADIFTELRADFPLLRRALESDPALMRALADAAKPFPSDVAAALAAGFDARLDAEPDAALRLTDRTSRERLAGGSLFEKLSRVGMRPHAHRARVSALFQKFAAALARPDFASARAALAPADHDAETVRLATMLFRRDALRALGGDTATEYFFDEYAPPERGFEKRLLKLAALAKADDAYGEALLLHRRASLERLVARFARLRFDAAAAAYALALDYRRATTPGNKWPKDTENLLAGLLDTYPADPFTDEPVAYSRKRLHLRSPGADGVDRGGIEDPEFATALAQLWEPTLPLEEDVDPHPAAFGLRPSDFDKPVPRPWEIPKPVTEGY